MSSLRLDARRRATLHSGSACADTHTLADAATTNARADTVPVSYGHTYTVPQSHTAADAQPTAHTKHDAALSIAKPDAHANSRAISLAISLAISDASGAI